MSEFERFALALAFTESDDTEVAWGDPTQKQARTDETVLRQILQVSGRGYMACGRWQMHPAWYAEWADPEIQVGWSWDQAFRAALRRFWDAMVKAGRNMLTAAMIFHLGMSAWARGDWDSAYGARFAKFADAQTDESKA